MESNSFNPYQQPATEVLSPDLVTPGPYDDVQPKAWPVAVIVLLSLASYLAATVVAIVIAALTVHGHLSADMFREADGLRKITQSRIGFPLIVIIPQVAMVIPAMLAASLSPLGFRNRLRLVRGHWPLGAWFAAALATPLIGMISSAIVGQFMKDSESLVEMSQIFRELAGGGFLIPLAVLIGATPGICEELLFRGYVQSRLTTRFSAPLGLFLTSVLFAAFHMDLVHSIAVFALGVWLGWICWQSGSIFPAMLAHFVNNSVSVVAVSLGPEPGSDEVSVVLAAIMLCVFSLGTAALVTTILLARRYRLPTHSPISAELAPGSSL